MTEPTYAPKPIKMLEVEDAVEPLDTDMSHIEPPLNEPQQPIGPDEIDKPSTTEEGESGSDPLRASIQAQLNTPKGQRLKMSNFGTPLTSILSRLKGK